jgi:hypothetical protein
MPSRYSRPSASTTVESFAEEAMTRLALLGRLCGARGMDHVVEEVTAHEIGAVAGRGGVRSGRHYRVLLRLLGCGLAHGEPVRAAP